MRKPLDRCVNGCDAPPHPPSWVLCEKCFKALDVKMESLADKLWPGTTRADRAAEGSETR